MCNNAPLEHCAAEAQTRAQALSPCWRQVCFCTFLIDLRHENPVLKVEEYRRTMWSFYFTRRIVSTAFSRVMVFFRTLHSTHFTRHFVSSTFSRVMKFLPNALFNSFYAPLCFLGIFARNDLDQITRRSGLLVFWRVNVWLSASVVDIIIRVILSCVPFCA